LSRDESDCVGLEEVDSLHSELETLLASVAKRQRLLQNELNLLNNWQEKGKDKLGGGGGSTPSHQSTPSSSSATSSTAATATVTSVGSVSYQLISVLV